MDPLDVAALLEAEDEPADLVTQRILEAAYDEILSFGLRRARVEDITRRAKVGRMTLHRRFPSKQALVGAVFLDQIRRIMHTASSEMDQHTGATDRLAHGLATGIHLAIVNPLLSRVLDTDPEALLPYLSTQADPLMSAATAFVAAEIADHPEAGRVAETIIRFSHSIMLLPRGQTNLRDPETLLAFLRPAIVALTITSD